MVELLAPVRDLTSFTAAVEAGADSVYFGLGTLNMRVSSKGISAEDLPEIVRRAHAKGVKVFVTVNTIVYEDEYDDLDALLNVCKDACVDAVICWDFAVIKRVKELGIPFHVSTQASVSNSDAANFYKSLGAERLVLARECSLEQVKSICERSDIEVEVFAHGAMCVAVSGRCFMSQFLYCRSANRGDCLQPCRREYRVTDVETGKELELSNGFVMSPNDLCTLPVLDKIVRSGIAAIKIEGRSRPVEYIKTVVSVYRRALDAIEDGYYSEELVSGLLEEVGRVYNRGFSAGFYLGRPGPQDWSDRKGSYSDIKKEYVGKVIKYFDKRGVAWIKVESHPVAVGDALQVQGPTTGVVDFAAVEVREEKDTFTVPCDTKVRPNDKVFRFVKKSL